MARGRHPSRRVGRDQRVATLPGVTPASPLQPIEGRVVMLQSGIKAPMAIRIYGDRLDELADSGDVGGRRISKSRPTSMPARSIPTSCLGKPYVEFTVDREAAARYGMTVADGQSSRRDGSRRHES